MEELNWIKRRYAHFTKDNRSDVTVTIHPDSRTHPGRLCIAFRRSSYVKITNNELIKAAPSGNRLYFAQAEDRFDGFKLTSFSEDKTKCNFKIALSSMPNDMYGISVGDYNLEYDKGRNLYYIDMEHKVK